MIPVLRYSSFLLFVSTFTIAADRPKSKFKFPLSREITYITEPLDQDGYLDYETALNDRLRAKTTPETNAVVVMLQIFGPTPESAVLHADFYRWLGVKEPPEEGDYFLDLEKYRLQTTLKATTDAERDIDDTLHQKPWAREQHPLVTKWLDANVKQLAKIEHMVARPDYFYPKLSTRDENGRRKMLIGALMPHVQKNRSLARALNIRAMRSIAEKEYEAAWRDTILCQKLGRMVARGATNIEMLVGQAIFVSAINTQLTLLERSKPDAKQSLAYLRDLQAIPPTASWLDKLNLGERFVILDAVQSLRRDADSDLPGVRLAKDPQQRERELDLFRWDVVFRTVMQHYDEYVDAVTPPLPDEEKKPRKMLDSDMELKRLQKLIEANEDVDINTAKSVGLVTIGLLLPAFDRLQNINIRLEQQTANVQLAFAIQAYRVDNGRYPAKLDDLASKYLKSVPLDFFSKKPLIYQPSENGYLFYSVGENRKDDGGVTFTDDPKGDDLRVRMPYTAGR